MSKPEPSLRNAYAVFEPVPLRWADNDVYGHVNNAIHYQLFDTAVNGWLLRAGLLELGAGETVFLVVSTACDYFAELAFPEPVEAGLRIEKLGRSSVTYGIGLFGSAQHAAAEGRFVHVQVARESRKPVALSNEARAILQRLVL